MTARLAVSAALALVLAAPSAALADDNQLWTGVSVGGPVAEGSRVLLSLEGHTRFREDARELDVTVFRPALGWRVNSSLDVFAGYTRLATRRDGPDAIEDRAFQQASYQLGALAGGRVSGRTRIEQRFRNTGSDAGVRARQQFRWSRPVGGAPLSLVLSNETFFTLNDTDWGQRSGFDQNRVFVGGAWQVSEPARLEAGYLNQHLNGRGGAADRNSHILSVSLAFSL